MKRVVMSVALVICAARPTLSADGPVPQASDLEQLRRDYADVLALQGTARQEILAIARLLRAKPEMAIDQYKASGEYCLKSGLGTMTHYASDSSTTREDIVYEFDAAGLTAAGLDPKRLPPLPTLGKMEPGQWYYLPEGQVDPHHKHTMPGTTLLIAVDVR
jgi:hypothetical protein